MSHHPLHNKLEASPACMRPYLKILKEGVIGKYR